MKSVNMTTEMDELSDKFDALTTEKGSNPTTKEPKRHLSLETLEALLKKTIQPALDVQKELERILPTDPWFARAERLRKKYELPKIGFQNFQRLLCGVRNFPFVLLQNPKNDHLEFKNMVRRTKTLDWLEKVLEEVGIKLDDIIIMDMFPMLTDRWVDQHSDVRQQAIDEMFALTLDFIHEFKPPVILSCQCFNPGGFKHWESSGWASFKHKEAENLRSSMQGAIDQRVSHFLHNGHLTHIVHGFHPAAISRVTWARRPEQTKRSGQAQLRERAEKVMRDAQLRRIIVSLYQPYAVWHHKYRGEKLE